MAFHPAIILLLHGSSDHINKHVQLGTAAHLCGCLAKQRVHTTFFCDLLRYDVWQASAWGDRRFVVGCVEPFTVLLSPQYSIGRGCLNITYVKVNPGAVARGNVAICMTCIRYQTNGMRFLQLAGTRA